MTGSRLTAERVYGWERDSVERSDGTLLSREDCRDLAAAASALLGIAEPGLRFVKSGHSPCWAQPSSWTVSISDWGRTRVTLLHEVAHLGSVSALLRGEDPHGPAFVRCAMDLYEAFVGMPMDRLEATAAAHGIAFAPRGARRAARGRPDRFMDVDF